MGYFANGTEGDMYFAEWCHHCVHWSDEHGCPCWLIHLQMNYEECNNEDSVLHKMIPRDGCENQQCFSFRKKEPADD